MEAIKDVRLPSLHSFALTWPVIRAEHLSILLHSHANTLQAIDLRNPDFYHGSENDIHNLLRKLKACTELEFLYVFGGTVFDGDIMFDGLDFMRCEHAEDDSVER